MPNPFMDVKPADDYSDIGGATANGAVTRYRFVALDATDPTAALAIATAAAGNVGICTGTAVDDGQSGLRFYGVYWLNVYPTAQADEISAGDYLAPTTGGYGIKVDPDSVEEGTQYNAIALEDGGTVASHVGEPILVRIEHGWLYAEEAS